MGNAQTKDDSGPAARGVGGRGEVSCVDKGGEKGERY